MSGIDSLLIEFAASDNVMTGMSWGVKHHRENATTFISSLSSISSFRLWSLSLNWESLGYAFQNGISMWKKMSPLLLVTPQLFLSLSILYPLRCLYTEVWGCLMLIYLFAGLFYWIESDVTLVGKCRYIEIKGPPVRGYFWDDLVIYLPCCVFPKLNLER